jgi:hypothetical protein
VFDALFGAAAGGDVAGDPALARLRAQRKSIFDASLDQLASMRAQLGVEDRIKLEAHANAIRSIEERLAGAVPATTGAAACAAPELGTVLDLNDDNNMPALGQLQMDMAAAALACDQTRILTIQWSYAESEHLYPFLGLNRNHHDISHQWDDPGMDMYSQIQTWYAEQLAYFLGKLDSYQEGDATLLDNTVVLWGTEIGESTQHALTQMPYMLAGGAGGRLNTGRLIDFGQGRTNNDMLLSIAHAMGSEDTTFGDPDFSTGPLTGLT